MEATDIAAWVGAATGTGALLWDVIKWERSGARLRATVSPNMTAVGGPVRDPGKYILVKVVNVGRATTTLQALAWHFYSNRFQAFRRKPSESFLAVNLQPRPLPHTLEPGGEWSGIVREEGAFAKGFRSKTVDCRIEHSMSKKALLVRVKIPKGMGRS